MTSRKWKVEVLENDDVWRVFVWTHNYFYAKWVENHAIKDDKLDPEYIRITEVEE